MGATETEDRGVAEDIGFDDRLLLGGAVGGLLAGVLMGLLMHYRMGIMEVVGGLYTVESATAGWIFHLLHAVLFGVFFAIGLQWQPFGKYDFGPVAIASLGIAWGVGLWMVAAGVIMPVWLDAMALPAPDLPNWASDSGIGHLVYGGTLGVVVAIVDRY
jgi:two-component system OmpR family sensor kinase